MPVDIASMKLRVGVLGLGVVLLSGLLSAAPSVAPVKATPVAAASAVASPVASARLASWVSKPANVTGVEVDDGKHRASQLVVAKKVTTNVAARLNVAKFGSDLHATLKDRVVGYAWQMRQNGNPIHTGIWEWAKRPQDGGAGWSLDTRMHIASISKLITGMAMVKLLDDKGLSYDTPIVSYLPGYWTKGTNVDKITFRHLLTHKSGFKGSASDSDYAFMKANVAEGVQAVGGGPDNYDYENMNYGLCRILIAVLNGDVARAAMFLPNNDASWDILTTGAYQKYVQDKVFTPSGVSNAGFVPVGKSALAYRFPAADDWNSGDLSSMAGGAAWRISVNELLNVMHGFRRKGTIMSSTKAQGLLDGNLGVDWGAETPAGKMYTKNGRWRNNLRTEQSVAYFFPQNIEMVLFVNSPVGSADDFLSDIVKVTYLNNLE